MWTATAWTGRFSLLLGGLALAGAARGEAMTGSAVSWWVFAPSRAEFAAATLTLDPPVPGLPVLSSACTGQVRGDGTAQGRCRITDRQGNGWDEAFRCDHPLGKAPIAGPAAASSTGCQGEVEITGGQGTWAGLSGHGLFLLYAVSVTPDGQIIGYALRRYDGDS